MCTKETKRALLRGVLDSIEEIFLITQDVKDSLAAPPKGLMQSFGPKIKQLLEHANAHPEEYDKVARAQRTVEEVKVQIVQNLDDVVERGERLEVIAEKAAVLHDNAQDFKKATFETKKTMQRQNLKAKLLYGGIVFLVIMALISLIMGVVGPFIS